MYKVCVFGGTAEGRRLAEFLSARGVAVTACVATEYGGALLEPAEHLTVSARRLPEAEIEAMLRQERFDLVIDATHPYAAHITESIAAACAAVGAEHLRLLRDEGAAADGAVYVEDAAAAVDYLRGTQGNILLTTGSKDLAVYAGLGDFARRVYARVLPMAQSLAACETAGLKPDHILAMQGPFSKELNVALLHSVNAQYLVTKDGGSAGGFPEKAAAAAEVGATLVVIGRPAQREGLGYAQVLAELCRRFDLARQAQVSVVGIGPGARGAMTGQALDAVAGADCVIGARRMLEAVARPDQQQVEAIAAADIAAAIADHPEFDRFAVVLSGDVGFFSGAKKLLPLLEGCRVEILPGLSSLVYLCARLGTSYEDVTPVSLHGRDRSIVQALRRHRRVFALVGGEDGVNRLCAALCDAGLGDAPVYVGQRLSYPDEQIFRGTAQTLRDGSYAALSAVLIEGGGDAVVTPGLPDELFQRSGDGPVVPMTKSEVRAVCLAKLQLTRSAVCWDVGAGTGSVSVEMALQAPDGQVYAVERNDAALALLETNRANFAPDNLTVVAGLAPEACRALPAPSHVFIGGSGGNMRDILALALEKNPAVRIVATAVTLESAAELTACMKDFTCHEAVSVSVARGRAAGAYQLMTAQNPVYIFTMQNTEDRP